MYDIFMKFRMQPEGAAIPGGIEIYVQLIWLFAIIITVLTLCLCYLYFAMRRSMQREQLSRAFSRETIEGLEIERRRISRELHDSVLPLVKGQPAEDLIRTICLELMPPDFIRLTFKDALAGLCDKFRLSCGIECACFIDEDLNFKFLDAEKQLHLYRIVQEALNNIEKHSGAAQIAVTARRNNRGNLLMCIADDGKGITDVTDAHGLGMNNMRQRAAILGAQLDFISESGNGLMVRIELPILPEKTNG